MTSIAEVIAEGVNRLVESEGRNYVREEVKQ